MEREIGRLFQDWQFEVTHLQECAVEQLIGMVNSDIVDALQPTVILLKPANRLWQRFFLDVGACIWEQWLDTDIDDLEDDSWRPVDYAERFGLRGAEIQAITCERAGEDMCSFITLRLSCGTLRLESQDAHDIESYSIISFLP